MWTQQLSFHSWGYWDKILKISRQHPLFCITMWFTQWKTINDIGIVPVALRLAASDLDKVKQWITDVLPEHLHDIIISNHFKFPLMLLSPKLNQIDFCLWRYLMCKVMKKLQSVFDMKDISKYEIVQNPYVTIHATLLFMISCMQCVIICEGSHLKILKSE